MIDRIKYNGTEYKITEAEQDSGWVSIDITGPFKLHKPSSGYYHDFSYRKIGDMVNIRGILEPTEDISVDAEVRTTVFTMPAEIRPTTQPYGHPVYRLCPSEGTTYFTIRLASSGAFTIINHSAGTIKTGDRLYIDVTYFTN